MKKNDIIIGFSAIVFSCLFYQQLPGINFLLFTLLISVLILLANPQNIKDHLWWYYCTCANTAGLMVFMLNSDLSIFACVVSLLVLGGKSTSRENSIAVSVLFSIYSVFSSVIIRMSEMVDGRRNGRETSSSKGRRMTLNLLLVLLIASLFFYLYRLSNPLFDNLAANIDFSWLNLGWVCFVLLGLLIIYGLMKGRRIELIENIERQISTDIDATKEPEPDDKKSIRFTAVLLFVLLNIMLLVMNSLDISNIYIQQKLPAGISLSDFVHQAVSSTVFSILIAVALITWFFKGWLNFDQSGKSVKILVYLWIAQSAFVVINTMIRNYWYIGQFQLTHLRIDVFVFLLLCLCGLYLTCIKLSQHHSAWRYARKNFEVWFLVLVMSSCVNWDRLIARYNISHATTMKPLDTGYLLGLSAAALPELVKLHNEASLSSSGKKEIRRKLLENYKYERFQQWPSYNLRTRQNQEALLQLKMKLPQ